MSAAPEESRALSFRDPSGRLLSLGGRLIRVVDEAGAADLLAFLSLDQAAKLLNAKRLVATRRLDAAEAAALLSPEQLRDLAGDVDAKVFLEHERVPFVSFPYEWAPQMLHAAGSLTLDLAEESVKAGFGLKDATPYNVLFRGPEPVFVDLLSFERRRPGDHTWLPYAQFVRTFLLPLLANRYFHLPPNQTLLTRRDGLEPEDLYRLTGPLRRLAPPFLGLVSMPTWLHARSNDNVAAPPAAAADGGKGARGGEADAAKARFILERLFKGLRRNLDRLAEKDDKQSIWTDYMTTSHNYTVEHLAAKEAFVRKALDDHRPRRVLDVGCNTGHFSAMSAKSGASVVAVDYDPVVVGRTWNRARAEQLDILPLVVDLTRPSPAVGWRNRECASFLERAQHGFDLVLMLAVAHHMHVSERVPLAEIVDLAASLTRDLVVIEFVGPEDSMFRRLARGRDALFAGLNSERFEEACRRRFTILAAQHVPDTSRWLYLLRRGREGVAA